MKADPQEKMSCRASSCFLNADINRSKHSNKVSFAAVSYREATKSLSFVPTFS